MFLETQKTEKNFERDFDQPKSGFWYINVNEMKRFCKEAAIACTGRSAGNIVEIRSTEDILLVYQYGIMCF